EPAPRSRGAQRPLGWGYPRMGHDLAAARVQLRRRPHRPEPRAGVGPAGASGWGAAGRGGREGAGRWPPHPLHVDARWRAAGRHRDAPRDGVAPRGDRRAAARLLGRRFRGVAARRGGGAALRRRHGRLALAEGGDAGRMRTTTAQHATTVPTVPTGVPGERLPVVASGPDALGRWGMWGLIATDAMLVGSLLASYFYLRFRSGAAGWPPDGIHKPELVLPLVMSAILWSSSLPVHIADRAIRRGHQRLLRIGLLGRFLLGATFLGMQLLVEYPKILAEFH